jgi:hypothetical protein
MANDINKALDKLEPSVRRAFLRSLQDIRSEAQLGLIARHLENGDISSALVALNLRAEFFQPLDDALRAAYLEGGRNALAGLPALTDPFPGGGLWLALMAGTRAPRLGWQIEARP